MKPGVYQHYKGQMYLVLDSTLDSTNAVPRPAPYVIYYDFDSNKLRVRQEFEFNQTVDQQTGLAVLITHPGAVQRFKFVRDASEGDLVTAVGLSLEDLYEGFVLQEEGNKPDGTDLSKIHRPSNDGPTHHAVYSEMICNIMFESANVRDVYAYGGKVVDRCDVANALAHSLAKEGLLKCPADVEKPIDMILFCPSCHERHLDIDQFSSTPHRTHECQKCGFLWAPAKVATRGVSKIILDENES